MVSIIIPAYNVEKYIRECLDSVVGQDYSDLEIIIVDDGSTDSTAEIASEYAGRDSRITLIRQSNAGVSAARNAALRVAHGEWLSFVDSDDALSSNCISVLTDVAKRSGCRLIYGGWQRLSDNLANRSVTSVSEIEFSVCDRVDVIENVLYQTADILPTPWGKLYHRSLLSNLKFDESCIYEDLDLFYRLQPSDDKIAITPTPVYFYRSTPGSLTNRFSSSRLNVLQVTARIEDYMAINHQRLLPAARDRRLSANFNMYCLLAIYDKEGLYSDVANECWHIIRTYRRESLLNPRVRLKNKFGIIASYFGSGILKLLSPLVYGKESE